MAKLLPLALLALVAFATLACAEPPPEEEVDTYDEEEIHPDDRAAAEADPGSSFHGGVQNTFSHDVLDKGVPKYVHPPSRDCKKSPDEKQCMTCCGQTGRSGRWVKDWGLKKTLKLKFKSCVCGNRMPRKE